MCHGRKSKSSVFDLLSGAKVTISPWSIKATGIAAVLVALAFVLAFLQSGISFSGMQVASYISSLVRHMRAPNGAGP
jgi:hypothetical protein